MYRLLAIAKYDERYVIPTAHASRPTTWRRSAARWTSTRARDVRVRPVRRGVAGGRSRWPSRRSRRSSNASRPRRGLVGGPPAPCRDAQLGRQRGDALMRLLPPRPERHPVLDSVPTPIVLHAASLVLAYPDQQLLDHLETIRAALAGTSAEEQFAPVLAHLGGDHPGRDGDPWSARPAAGLPRGGVRPVPQALAAPELLDRRRHPPARRGPGRRAGASTGSPGSVVDTGGELPDYLPLMLEFAAASPSRGLALLQRFRASLELHPAGAERRTRSPHAGVLAAVCACLARRTRRRPEPRSRPWFGDVAADRDSSVCRSQRER